MTSYPSRWNEPQAGVRYADAEPNGLAHLVGRLLDANLDRRPRRRRLLRPAVIELVAGDVDVGITVRLQDGAVEVENGRAGSAPDVSVVANSHDLLALAAVPLRLGMPDVLRRPGRAAVRKILARDVRVSGMVRHPIMVSRLLRLLSVAG